jgi:hypothetical protein
MSLSLGQRIVAVVGLGGVLLYLGNYLVYLWGYYPTRWTGYAPLTEAIGTTAAKQLLIRGGLTVVWIVFSMVILRSKPMSRDSND